MTPKNTQTQSGRNDDVEARITVLEYQFGVMSRGLERIESKQDAAIRQIDTLKYVSSHEFEENNKTIARTYATMESIKPMKTLFWTLITASVVGLISLGFFIIQSLIKP